MDLTNISKGMISSMTGIRDAAIYTMKRGIDSHNEWHSVREGDDVYVVLHIGLPETDEFPMYAEVDSDTYGKLTGIRLPVGNASDYPKLYGDDNEKS